MGQSEQDDVRRDASGELEQDDSELVIVDLDQDGRSIPSTPARTVRAPRFTLRQRRKQAMLTVVMSFLALTVFLASYTPTRTLINTVLSSFIPTPVLPLLPGEDRFFISGYPWWGQFSIDGKVLTHLPVSGRDEPLQLARGKHTIKWQTRPLDDLVCTLSVPPRAQDDSCGPYLVANVPWPGQHDSRTAWQLELVNPFPSLSYFPILERREFYSVIQSALSANSSGVTVQPGELYAVDGEKVPQVAKTPFYAQLNFTLNTIPGSTPACIIGQLQLLYCQFQGRDCHTFCDFSDVSRVGAFAPAGGDPLCAPGSCQDALFDARNSWFIVAIADAHWVYSTQQGGSILGDSSDYIVNNIRTSQGAIGQGNEYALLLKMTWREGEWQAQPLFSEIARLGPAAADSALNPVCATAWDDKSGSDGAALARPGSTDQVTWRFVSSDVKADGCLAIATIHQNNGQQTQTAYLLHRFGVYLAANDVAHRQWPALPVASASLQGVIQHLASFA